MPGILLNNAYNHYLTTYASKEVSQSDTHKKEDLRSVYRSIVKSNQKNPTHLTGQNDHAEESAIDLKESARRLQRTLASLGDIGQEKPLSSRSAFSSNEAMVSATYIGNDTEEPPSFSVKVDQLANEQINTGKTMPKGEVKLAPGSYAFNIRMDGQVYELQYSIKSGETNQAVQEKLSRLINKAGIGIKAAVATDEGGKSTMTLSSATTGAGSDTPEQFRITEESDSGLKGTVSYFGLDRMTQIPHDAKFKINGTSHTAASNHFTVSKMYELTLNRVGNETDEAFIGIKDKQESMIDHVHTLVDTYNKFLDSVSNIGSVKVRTGKITSDAVRAAKNSLDGQESVGISIAENGKLLVDENRLHEASEIPADQLDEKMQPVRDFANSLYSISKDIALNPMQYIDRPIVAYKDPSRETAPNPYMTSEYSGMLFNNYC